jgi:molybdopterin converting factor small subunit
VRIAFRLAGPLRRHADGASIVEVEVAEDATVLDALEALAASHPAVERRIRDEQGHLRAHVNLFVGDLLVRGTATGLGAAVRRGDELTVLPAVSGGAEPMRIRGPFAMSR